MDRVEDLGLRRLRRAEGAPGGGPLGRMAITGFSSMRIASYWWYLPRRSLTAAVCSPVPGSRSSALPRTITKARGSSLRRICRR